ncbi:hypothetical protein [Klenkia sp. PcliD-1-E]|uniref:hypothetical protein n=1 Tax=Klenkia sp. PcliD-1-E TaxID=2954492 RepID=UPI002097C25C|nr:hypothetical protein [Klenkia sp. PcliD-1-E]MCO7218345.1 hypothetical protein [Klenkia sp. PcliD-1-E]
MSTQAGPSAAEFRSFVRAAHPDVGGDPDTFAAGLAARGRGPRPTTGQRITVVPGRSLTSRLRRLRRALRPRPPRSTPLR